MDNASLILETLDRHLNHPARLIYEFPILKQEGDSLTIKVDRASPIGVSLPWTGVRCHER